MAGFPTAAQCGLRGRDGKACAAPMRRWLPHARMRGPAFRGARPCVMKDSFSSSVSFITCQARRFEGPGRLPRCPSGGLLASQN